MPVLQIFDLLSFPRNTYLEFIKLLYAKAPMLNASSSLRKWGRMKVQNNVSMWNVNE